MTKMGEVIKGLVERAQSEGEPVFHPFGGGLVMRVKWQDGLMLMQIALERERIMPSNTEMDMVGREMRGLGWDEVKEAGPDWSGYLCRRYVWFAKLLGIAAALVVVGGFVFWVGMRTAEDVDWQGQEEIKS